MEELGDEDVLDPNPDIHALFCHYNSLYFGDSLGACSVCWSNSRMTRCAGVCHYRQRGVCEIRLSEPLLKFRPTADLKNTLLHEMIHAFLWVENRNRDHSDHGPSFQRLMNDINRSPVDDHQRPAGGYSIGIYHDFHAEVENYQVHQWMCKLCGDLIKRAINRAPGASDCIQKAKHYGPCANPSCHWHRHEKECSGRYTKIAEPPGYEAKGLKGKHQKDGTKALSHESGGKVIKSYTEICDKAKDKQDAKRKKTITNFFPVVDSGNLDMNESTVTGGSLKHPEQIAIGTGTRGSTRKRKLVDVEENCHSHQSQYTVISKWLDWYAVEEGVDDVEPLINKRTERRNKQREIMCSERRVLEDDSTPDASTEVTALEVTESKGPAGASPLDRTDGSDASPSGASGLYGNVDTPCNLATGGAAAKLIQSRDVNILVISDD